MADLPPTVAPEAHPRTAAWLAQPPSRFAGRTDRPLFIGGCPRSGTTLLRAMLDAHPDLGMPHESDFVRALWWERRRFGDLRDPDNRRAVGEWIFSGPTRRGHRLRDKKIGKAAAVARVVDADPTIGSIIATCFAMYADVHGKTRWGDKRPSYNAFLPQLFELFEDMQYVNVIRDPRGAVASQALMPWDAREVAVPAGIVRWEGAVRRTDRFAEGLRPDQLLDVRYEDLTRDPATQLARICEFAKLRGGEAIELMIDADSRDRVRGDAHVLVDQPVTTQSVERWRKRLRPEEVALIEQAAAPYMDRFGYRPVRGGAPSAADMAELTRRRRQEARMTAVRRAADLVRRARYRRPVAAVR
ncbi:MAG: hypothetical protein QOF76_1603 [Solirubrobacteraceae bacterium]|jgi:hypothetical protein|nr:hypothetical protein [Solirubrobacteraceae bacterium]